MATLAELVVKISADTAGMRAGLASAQRSLDSFGSHAASQLGGRLASQAKIAALAITGIGIAAGTATVTAGFGFNSMRQQAQIAFETMLGSGQKAKKFLDELQAFAAKTPFEFSGLVQGAQRLLAMGFAAEDVLPTLTAVGDAVAGLGGNGEMIDRVTRALGQMMAKGKVSAEEMMQLAESGIPAWKMLADAIGVTVPEAMKMSERGAISASTAISALVDGMNAKFGGMMEKQSITFAGLLSTIKDTFGIISGQVMQPFFDMATKGMQRLVDFTSTPAFTAGVERFTQRITEATKAMEDWLRAHKDELVEALRIMAKGLQEFGDAARDFGSWIIANQVRLVVAITAIGLAFAWTNPLIALLIGVGGLTFALGAVGRSAEGLKGPLDAAGRAAAGFRLEILKGLKPLLEFVLTLETLGLSSIPGFGDKIQQFLAEKGLSGVAEGLEYIDAEIAELQASINAYDSDPMVGQLMHIVNATALAGAGLEQFQRMAYQGATATGIAAAAAMVPARPESMSEELARRFGIGVTAPTGGGGGGGGGGGKGGGGGGGGGAEALTLLKALSDSIIDLGEAAELGIDAMAAAQGELGAAAGKDAEEAWRAQVELSKLAINLGDAGVSKAAFDFAVLAGILSGELKNTGLALEGFIEDGVISLKEQLVLGLNPAQAAAIELARERFIAEQDEAEAANRANVELIKLATVMGEKGVTGASVAFWVACDKANQGTLTLTDALNLGLMPAEAATIQAVADVAKAHQALQDAIYDVMVQMATFTLQLKELPSPVADSVRELYNLGIQLGSTGLGRQALDFELAMVAVHSAFGDARRAAADFAHGVGVELVNQLQSALGQLLGGGTVETAQLQLQIDTLAYQLAVQEAAGATDDQTQAIRDQIAALQSQQDVYTAEHRVMQDRATLADQMLPTERELKDMVAEITKNIGIYSGKVDNLSWATGIQTLATANAVTQTDKLADVALGASDYMGFFTRSLGDSAGRVIDMNFNLAVAGRHVIDVFNSISTPSGYQSGLSYVPHTMLAQVHPQEAILTAAEARDWRSGRSGGSAGTTIINRQNYGRQNFNFARADPRETAREIARQLRGV